MSQTLNRNPKQLLEDFEADFFKTCVKRRVMMRGNSIAVFAEGIKLIPDDCRLFGGADFVRFKFHDLMSAAIIWSALQAGGRIYLMTIITLLQSGDTSAKQAKIMRNALTRFKALLDRAEDAFSLAQPYVASGATH